MQSQDIFLRNNTGSKSKSSLVEGFVIRTQEFDKIRTMLNDSKTIVDIKNTIIIGQRGAGKTTLIYRLNYAIQDELKLSQRYLPILFSEEQYNLSDLTNLWEAIAIAIEDNFYKEKLTSTINAIIDFEKDYENASYKYLYNFLTSKDKIAILFIENLNFFMRKLSGDERRRLGLILTSDSSIRIIGSSTSINDGSIDFGEPMFRFFDIIRLDSLNHEECEKLLINIGKQHKEEEQIREIISNSSGRIEALRRLTGGVPRTISYFFQIFLDNDNGKAIKDLYLLIDTLTLLYKSELDQLSAQQQKVIDAIAMKWDAVSVKEVVKRTRLESNNISSILSYLERNQIIEKVQTSSRNHLYRIKDRFMNIWYLMRFGRKHDKDNVVWLVRFFDMWCDETELAKRVRRHIDNLKGGEYDVNAAIDMRNTFLSCENLPDSLKEELIITTNSILPDRLLKNTRTIREDLLDEIKKLVKEEKFDEAVKSLSEINVKNLDFYLLSTSLYLLRNEPYKALEAAEAALALDNQNSIVLLTLGLIFDFHLEDMDKAIGFYEKCLNTPQPHAYAANRLGEIYRKKKDYDNAIKYHEFAVSKTFKQSLISLGDIYLKVKDFANAEINYREAIKFKQKGAYTKLAKVLTRLDQVKETEIALLDAVAASEDDSNINLGRFYLLQKRPLYKKAEEQFKIAIEKQQIDGYSELGKLYIKKKELDKAISILNEGLKLDSSEAAHHLGHVYLLKDDFEKSDEMFERAIALGDVSVIECWVEGIYNAKRTHKKSFVKELLEKYNDHNNKLHYSLLYAKILLWNGYVTDSIRIIDVEVKELSESYNDEGKNNKYFRKALSKLVSYFLLLIAQNKLHKALSIFENSENVDLKSMLKPIYYLLMQELKEEFPMEYLKAGKELTETIDELKKEVEYLRK